MFSRMHLWYLLFSVDVIYIHMVWIFFCQLSSSHDNSQSRVIYHSCMKHAPSVAIVLWQRSGHGYRSLRYQSCSVSCHRLMTTDRTWLYIPKVWNLLCQLSMSHLNIQSMVIYPSGMNHAPSVVIVSWQQSEHGAWNISYIYETCPTSCLRRMTTDRAWLYIPKVWIMLRQLFLSHDIGRSMDLYHLGMKHAPSVVIVS